MFRGNARNARNETSPAALPSCKRYRPNQGRKRISPRGLSPGCIPMCSSVDRQRASFPGDLRPRQRRSCLSLAPHRRGWLSLLVSHLCALEPVAIQEPDQTLLRGAPESWGYRCRIFGTSTLRQLRHAALLVRVGPHREDGHGCHPQPDGAYLPIRVWN